MNVQQEWLCRTVYCYNRVRFIYKQQYSTEVTSSEGRRSSWLTPSWLAERGTVILTG